MNQEKLNIIKSYLKAIEKEKNAAPFLEPVDYIGLCIPDYPKIITKPMDLRTVRENIEGNKYENVDDIYKDIQLIWDNCKKYNIAGCPIYKCAQSCEKFTKKYFEKNSGITTNVASKTIKKGKSTANNQQPSKSAFQPVSNESNTNVIFPNPDLLDDNHKIDISPFNNNTNINISDIKIPDVPLEENENEENTNPNGLNSIERQSLSNRVKRLQNDGLTSLVRLVQKECPDCVKETEENIEILLTVLDKKTYEQINRLIDTFLKVKETNQENLDKKK